MPICECQFYCSLAGQTLTPGRESGQTRMLTWVCTVCKTNNGYNNQVLMNRPANCMTRVDCWTFRISESVCDCYAIFTMTAVSSEDVARI